MMRVSRKRRRGGIYVLVLVNSAILMLIGLSALTVTRIQRRVAQGTGSAVQSRLLAETAMDAGLFTIDTNANWRSDHPNDTWSSALSLGGGTLQYKFVDEIDGDLTDDPDDPVRLYGKGEVDGTLRMFSVVLAPVAQPVDLTTNPGFESGTSPWTASACDIEVKTADPPVGAAFLMVTNRSFSSASVYQDVTAGVQYGGTYVVDLWVMMKDSPEDVRVSLVLSTSTGSNTETISLPADTTWQRVTGELEVSWSGTLSSATLEISTSSTNQRFVIDEFKLQGNRMEPSVPIPGTWRREMVY